ncbi:type II toxin-antitoxin system HicB family antitoxin [Algoriphagus sp.]|uniref:type II toxin-antitoxin system HicB family antitoxin n=1 Tax=Algoriphagus sp. TaxID=1872435 RepID=UPI00391DA122
MKYLEYRGFTGSIEYSPEDDLLFGKILGIQGLISYEGVTGKLLEEDFKTSIDEYLAICKEQGKAPEKSFKGSFNVRIPAELHQRAALKAMEEKSSLNNLVSEAIRSHLSKEKDVV